MDSLEKYSSLRIKGAEYLPGGYSKLCTLLDNAEKENKQLRVKLGIDPTSTDLHFGHTVCLQILRKFQELGHKPVLIIGGYTAMLGDPSGRNEARPPLTFEEVEKNARTYLDQVEKILDLSKVEVVNNYDWLNNFSLSDVLQLAHLVTVNQLIAKDAFGSRISKGLPLYLHEVMYPILQGYDSVKIESDIELGGVDQKFNVLFGRNLQKQYEQKEQFAILLPLLIGLDGSKKMSKSFKNYIALNDSPNEMFGKTMSIPDELIMDYYHLVSSFNFNEINKAQEALDSGTNPRDIKINLAKNLVEQIYTRSDAESAHKDFTNQFSKNQIPDSIPEFKIEDPLKVSDLMCLSKMTETKSEAKKLIKGGGVKLQSSKVIDPNLLITESDKNSVLQIGKRKFVKII